MAEHTATFRSAIASLAESGAETVGDYLDDLEVDDEAFKDFARAITRAHGSAPPAGLVTIALVIGMEIGERMGGFKQVVDYLPRLEDN